MVKEKNHDFVEMRIILFCYHYFLNQEFDASKVFGLEDQVVFNA